MIPISFSPTDLRSGKYSSSPELFLIPLLLEPVYQGPDPKQDVSVGPTPFRIPGITFATSIRFRNSMNRWNSTKLQDLLRSIASMHQYLRERSGMIEILAEKQD
ncbi:hypothetical protein [Methanospirillum sp.]